MLGFSNIPESHHTFLQVRLFDLPNCCVIPLFQFSVLTPPQWLPVRICTSKPLGGTAAFKNKCATSGEAQYSQGQEEALSSCLNSWPIHVYMCFHCSFHEHTADRSRCWTLGGGTKGTVSHPLCPSNNNSTLNYRDSMGFTLHKVIPWPPLLLM